MARGQNAAKNGHCGREYWSRRPFSGWGWGKALKVMTHRMERRVLAKRSISESLVSDED